MNFPCVAVSGACTVSRFIAVFLLASALLVEPGAAESGRAPTAPPLTTAFQVISLSPEAAARGQPVRLTGIVLLVSPEDHAIVMHDESGAIYLQPLPPSAKEVCRGDRVVVEGIAQPGSFAPMVRPVFCTVVGTGPIPAAQRVAVTQLMNGAYDGQWVEVTGVARAISPLPGAPSDSLVEIVTDEVRLPLRFYQVDPQTAQTWIDSKITVRGVCFHFYNQKGQLFDAQIGVPKGEGCKIEPPPAQDQQLLPVRPLSSLLRYEPQGSDAHRVHVRAVVTYVKPGYFFFVQEGKNGVQVHTRQSAAPAVGDLVDVVGFIGRASYGPLLEDAEFTRSSIRQTITSRFTSRSEALQADGELVVIKGRLVNTFWGPDESVLLVQLGNSLISAHLTCSSEARARPIAENGSVVELTGVCRVLMGSPARSQWKWAPQSFELLLRTPSDVTVITPPPWWSASRALWSALVILSGATAVIGFFFLRSRVRLREQRQNRLAAEGQFAAVFNERNRLAREIHDTLAQGLTGISIQVEMAKERLASPPAALKHLEIARTLVRSSLAEARRSVWGLRPQICENQDLSSALSEIAQQLTAGTDISVEVRASPAKFHLPPYLEADLLRIGQEAMTNAVKHARPRNILVELLVTPKTVELRVRDDGCGYSAGLGASHPGGRTGFGILGMRERVQQLKGEFSLAKTAGGGTELTLHVPLTLP